MNKELIIKVLENALRSDTMRIDHKMPITEAMLESIIEVLKESERKTGKWVKDKYGNVICSECKWCAPMIMQGSLINRHLDYEKSNFCWNCGADMEVEDDN